MSTHSQEAPREKITLMKMTLMIDAGLREQIEAERLRIQAQSGFRVSRTQIVERMVRRALNAGSTEPAIVAPA